MHIFMHSFSHSEGTSVEFHFQTQEEGECQSDTLSDVAVSREIESWN